ncbi:MAG: hypothetical protein ACYDEV_10740 [Acidiferrobacter sp.]
MTDLSPSYTLDNLAQTIKRADSVTIESGNAWIDELKIRQPILSDILYWAVQDRRALEQLDRIARLVVTLYLLIQQRPINKQPISIEGFKRHTEALIEKFRSIEGHPDTSQNNMVRAWVEDHPERFLLAYVFHEITTTLALSWDSDRDRTLLITVLGFVDSISYRSLREKRSGYHPQTSGEPPPIAVSS